MRKCESCGSDLREIPPAPVPTDAEKRLAALTRQVNVQAARLRLVKALRRQAWLAVQVEMSEAELSAASLAASSFGIREADEIPPTVESLEELRREAARCEARAQAKRDYKLPS